MIHAYQEIFLSRAQSLLGEAFDFAVNDCNIPGEAFIKQFIASSMCERLENADPAILSGKSGIELALDVVQETTGKRLNAESEYRPTRSAEYWIGWAVAYYQWWSGRKFSTIFAAFEYDDLKKMYYTLHEADISKFADIADSRIKELFPETNLRRIRTIFGYSQSELAKASGVSLRSIQMYEQRNKDINKSSSETMFRLSKALGCRMEDLIER